MHIAHLEENSYLPVDITKSEDTLRTPQKSSPTIEHAQNLLDDLDFGIEVPVIQRLNGQVICLVEAHTLNLEKPHQHIESTLEQLHGLFPNDRLSVHLLSVETPVTPNELHFFRRMKISVPSISSVSSEFGTLRFEHSGPSPFTKKEKQRIRSAAIQNYPSTNLEFERGSNPLPLLKRYDSNVLDEAGLLVTKRVWRNSEQFLYASNLIIDSDKNQALVTLDGVRDQLGRNINKKGTKAHGAIVRDAPSELEIPEISVTRRHEPRALIRALLQSLPESIEGLRVMSSENSTAIHCLLNIFDIEERDSIEDSIYEICDEYYENNNSYTIDIIQREDTKDSETTTAFHNIPLSWRFKDLHRTYHDDAKTSLKSVQVNCARLPEDSSYDKVIKTLKEAYNAEVYTELDVLQPIEVNSDTDVFLRSRLPSGADIHSIEENQVSGEYVITSERPIHERYLEKLGSALGRNIINSVSPFSIEIPTHAHTIFQRLHRGLPLYSEARRNNEHATIQGYGACQEIGRSCFFKKLPELNIIHDAGSGYGKQPYPLLPRELAEQVDVVLLSHAHLDHTGFLQHLRGAGFNGIIIATEATLVTAQLNVYDAAKFSTSLYHQNGEQISPATIEEVFSKVAIVKNGHRYQLAPNTYLTVRNSGHLLGSSTFTIEAEGVRTFTYTGDFLNSHSKLHAPVDIGEEDIVLFEATYGSEVSKRDRRTTEVNLQKAVRETLEQGGTVLAPVLLLGRSIELLSIIHEMKDYFIKNNNRFKVYTDGSIFEMIKIYEYFLRKDPSLFNQDNLKLLSWLKSPQNILNPLTSKSRQGVMNSKEPKVVLTSSGMLHGLAEEYFEKLKGNEKNLLLLSCYQVEKTKGGRLLQFLETGEYEREFKGTEMRVERFRLSGHSTQDQSLDYLRKSKAREAYLIHADCESLSAMKDAINNSDLRTKAAIFSPEMVYDISENVEN